MSYRVNNNVSELPLAPAVTEQLGLAIADILSLIKPSDTDHGRRETIMIEFRNLIKSLGLLKDASVEPYGSFLYGIYAKKADLDISVDITSSSFEDADFIPYIWRALVKRNFEILNLVPDARIPLLTFESKRWNIACDVTINNYLGKIKSKFLLWISKIDKRFGDMVLLVKEWAKAHDINDPKEGTLNSYALCLLVIFHLQTCVPAILPPLKEIYAGGVNTHPSMRSTEEMRIQRVCATNIEKFISTRTVNRSTLPQLMVSFFGKFSQLEATASKHVISTYSGKWEGRNSYRWAAKKASKLAIEDPLELSDNAARTVSEQYHLSRISQAMETTYSSLWQAAPSRASYKACLLGQKSCIIH